MAKGFNARKDRYMASRHRWHDSMVYDYLSYAFSGISFIMNHYQMKDVEISDEQIEDWLGNDWKFSEIVEILKDIANHEYDPNQMRCDILTSPKE